MEMSHRSKVFVEIAAEMEALMRELMGIPANYKVLYLQGGASMQFAQIPMNLMVSKKADYLDTGEFASKAIGEAEKFGTVNIVASSKEDKYTYIPDIDPENLDASADYLHMTTNNTIFGTRHAAVPKVSVPLVSDMSSCILSEVYDVNDYGLIYAGAQKNIAPAGVTFVIIREDLLARSADDLPYMFSYKTLAKNESMINTPPCYSMYMAKLVFEWLKDFGGVAAIQKVNEEKAQILYDHVDNSKLFSNPVRVADRSIMNVPFVTGNEELDSKFIKEAEKAGFVNLKGHRIVGGMRASIYNAMPSQGVKALVEFMKIFEVENK